jgi:hypothetical protein
MRFTAKQEATKAFQQLTKAMSTIRGKYTKEGQADRIIDSIIADKFGSDADLSMLIQEFSAGKYDVLVGRMRQADHIRYENTQIQRQIKQQLLDEMSLLYA